MKPYKTKPKTKKFLHKSFLQKTSPAYDIIKKHGAYIIFYDNCVVGIIFIKKNKKIKEVLYELLGFDRRTDNCHWLCSKA